MLLDNLNEAQALAVKTTEGPVMVMAGAGSGKTKVLTTRIAYIIEELGVNPYSILAVTFTNKAAKEMKDRIGNLINIDTKYLWISTFHSFCVRVLRNDIDKLPPYKKGFNIIDDDDQLKIVKDLMANTEYESKPREILKNISKAKNNMTVTFKSKSKESEFYDIKDMYQNYLKRENLLDFDDLIINTIKLFEADSNILAKYQNQFNYVMVDEFQDTNSLQYKLIKMLVCVNRNLFVVGDDFQSIYSFRGAKIENIMKMRNDFKDTKLILLEKNYRSTTEILNLANSVITNNPNQIKKVMTSNNKTGNLPTLYRAFSSYDEVSFVVDKIKELHAKGDKYEDFAILYRANSISREFEDILVRNKIPYKIYGGLSFFQRLEVKDILSYIKVIVNSDDNFSFKRIINKPKRKIGNALLDKLEACSRNVNKSLYDSIPFYEGGGEGAKNLAIFKTTTDSIKAQLDNVKLVDLVDIILKEYNYKQYLKEEFGEDKEIIEERMDNIYELKSVLKESEEFYEGDNIQKLTSILEDLALRIDNEEFKDDDCVRLSTFHQAKGLEFKTVFMVAMEDGIFPNSNIESEFELEEERRICYVGVTRAKDNLFLTCADSRMRYGQKANNPMSCFIYEMDSNCYEEYVKKTHNVNNTTLNFKQRHKELTKKTEEIKPTNSIDKGDKINHKLFGDGIVVSKVNDTITVAFSKEYGIKKLKADHPSIKKI
ncbi:MAG: UvrD-helicase domain-containing protein [Acholeplasmatales bacterium]|nr:UvrD-helicase domain-containing protein [Acholeplasmatales bacterium]